MACILQSGNMGSNLGGSDAAGGKIEDHGKVGLTFHPSHQPSDALIIKRAQDAGLYLVTSAIADNGRSTLIPVADHRRRIIFRNRLCSLSCAK